MHQLTQLRMKALSELAVFTFILPDELHQVSRRAGVRRRSRKVASFYAADTILPTSLAT